MAKSTKLTQKHTVLLFSLTQFLKPVTKKFTAHLLSTFLSLMLITLGFLLYDLFMEDKFYPFTFVGDTPISFLTLGQSESILSDKLYQRSNQKLEFRHLQKVYSINLATASANLDYSILEQKFKKSHPPLFLDRLSVQIHSLFSQNMINPKVNLKLDPQLDSISTAISIPAQNAQLIFDEKSPESSSSANIQVKDGLNGVEFDNNKLKNELINYLLTGQYNHNLPVKIVTPQVTSDYIEKIKTILEISLKNPLKLQFEQSNWVLDTKQLLAILDLESGQNLILDKEKTHSYLAKIAQIIDRQVQEGHFEFNPQTKRVTTFKPSIQGRRLDIDKTLAIILDSLNNPSAEPKIITLPVATTEPKIKTSDVNNLGIKELLAEGVSHFSGSIPNRIYNINLAASRINGVLIAPGETFSFNNEVGDISAASGYKPAYVIKSGRTVLDDGGGVCQVSTTTFRAVLNSGLPVVQRVAHAYRVGYYEQGFPPGLDATVFAPSVDFKFKNDTQNHILIQAYTVGATLYVDLYGTPDGRFATISKSTVANQTPPPPELRQDDPTLPKGEVKQVDFPAWGANVSFSRTVKRAGEVLIQETFKSNYKAWQAIYLVGTKEN